MTGFSFALFPLQVSITNFALDMDSSVDPAQLIGFLVAVAVIIVFSVILSKVKKTSSSAKSSGGEEPGGLLYALKMNRIAKDIGLNHEQKKMLTFIFKTDYVIEPEKSIHSMALLDRHFKRACKAIEQTSTSAKEVQNKLYVLFSVRNILENTAVGGFNSTHQIKDDTSLSFTFNKEKITVHILSARGDIILTEIPKNVLGSQLKINKGDKLTAMFFTKNNKGFSFETRVLGFSGKEGGGRPAMQLAHSNQLKFLSQRRFRRKHAHIACSLNLVYVEGSGKKQRLLVDKRRVNGTIADISVGGCSIKASVPVQVGARFKIEFKQGDENVATLGQVLRTNKTGVVTIIHVRFLKVSQKSMNTINAFVYEYGRE